MKFSWKMILLTTVLMSISLSTMGYFVVSGSFDSQLNSKLVNAQEDMHLFSTMLQAVTATQHEAKNSYELKAHMQELTKIGAALYGYEFSLWNENHSLLFTTQKGDVADVLVTQESYVVHSRVRRERSIVTTLKMPLCGHVCYIQRQVDISQLYEQTNESLKRCQYIMLIVWSVCVAMTTFFAMFLTRPLRKISRIAKQFSQGSYHKRADIRTNDEVGQLANDFNSMADALEGKIAELADALRRQKEFTASFAHELKTPLTSVIGYADTLRSRELDAKQRFLAADYIVSEGRRLETMSFALLDLFALERKAPSMRYISSKKLASQVEGSCRYLLEQKNTKLCHSVEDVNLYVMPELMHTLLYNLIDNARKASAQGSKIFLKGEMSKDGYLFAVTDRGRGMPQEAIDRITEPFYMVDKSRSRAEGGAGLGLALCEKIAQLHDTTLEFSSEVGKGTCVRIFLRGKSE